MAQNNNNKLQLFINFRGHDERLKLLPHLKYHLKGSKANVFTDADAIGEPLENLFKHIRESRIVIVIFSINYLESWWCLEELVHIRKCLMVEKIDFAIPILYNVKASHVKDQTGDFGEKFVALQNEFPQFVKRWKKALIYIANFGGLSYDKNGAITELDFFKTIVERVDIVLTKIASKDSSNNNSSVLTKRSQEEAANLNKFEMVMDDINRLFHFSKALQALDLQRRTLEDYNKGVYNYLNQLSYNYPPCIEESSWSLDHNSPVHDWPNLDYTHRRTNSSPNNIYQIHPPLSDETTMVQNHPAQVSTDHFLQDETTMVQNHLVVSQVSTNNYPLEETTVVQNHPVVTQVSTDNFLQDETPVVQSPVETPLSNDNILQDLTAEVQTPAVTQVSNDNTLQDVKTEVQSSAVTQVSNPNNLQRKCIEKRNEDIGCVVFMWYCFKLWLYHT